MLSLDAMERDNKKEETRFDSRSFLSALLHELEVLAVTMGSRVSVVATLGTKSVMRLATKKMTAVQPRYIP